MSFEIKGTARLLKTFPAPRMQPRITGGLWSVQTGRQLEGRSCSQPPSAGGRCPSPFPGHLFFLRKGGTGTWHLRTEVPKGPEGLGLLAKPQVLSDSDSVAGAL